MFKQLLKLLFLPFVIIWKVLTGVIKLIFFTQLLITLLVLVVSALAAFVFFNSDHVISQKILGLLKGGIR